MELPYYSHIFPESIDISSSIVVTLQEFNAKKIDAKCNWLSRYLGETLVYNDNENKWHNVTTSNNDVGCFMVLHARTLSKSISVWFRQTYARNTGKYSPTLRFEYHILLDKKYKAYATLLRLSL